MRLGNVVKGAGMACLWVAGLITCLLVSSGGRGLGEQYQIPIIGIASPRAATAPWQNVTCVSDGWDGVPWNDEDSISPAIAVGPDGTVHVVWQDNTDGLWGSDLEIFYAKWTAMGGWSNATCVSDGWDGVYWNAGDSSNPAIAVGPDGSIHVVWQDVTGGPWGSDIEILHATWTAASGWSNATCVSDSWSGGYWNSGFSIWPTIAVGPDGTVHVAWWDDTDGTWGTDTEIIYKKWTTSTGWSPHECVSDGWGGGYWNTGESERPAIAVGPDGTIHLVWQDATDGLWGVDAEILHAVWTTAGGWSNVTCVSDGWGGAYWNWDYSLEPAIAVGPDGSVHSVWYDGSNSPWGIDVEILHAVWTAASGWSNATCVSDGWEGVYWNGGDSLNPAIAVGPDSAVQVVWEDNTVGSWGSDPEILFARWSAVGGWSNATCVSDGWEGVYWNGGDSLHPAIALGFEGTAHIVWDDKTASWWGPDDEILHAAGVVDGEAPVVTIHAPGSGQAFDFAPAYSFAVRDVYGVGGVWCSLDGGATNATLAGVGTPGAGPTNVSVACNGTIDQALWNAAPIGSVTITVYARDLVGNVASVSVVVSARLVSTILLVVGFSVFGVILAAYYVKIIAPRRRARRIPPST